jgi:hypothetical protein
MPDPDLTLREGGPQTEVTVREAGPHTDVTVREGALTGFTFLGYLAC